MKESEGKRSVIYWSVCTFKQIKLNSLYPGAIETNTQASLTLIW